MLASLTALSPEVEGGVGRMNDSVDRELTDVTLDDSQLEEDGEKEKEREREGGRRGKKEGGE